MVYINNINKSYFQQKIGYVICDFDRTISTYESDCSWDLFRKSNLVPDEYKKLSSELFNLYRPMETSSVISLDKKRRYMEDWALQQFALLKKYVSPEIFYEVINNNNVRLRNDFKQFIEILKECGDIPLYIVSGGLYQPIINILKKNGCYRDYFYIKSNEVIIRNNQIVDITRPVIHSQNKKGISLGIDSQKLGLLFGDLPGDIDIGYGLNTINCGFLNDQDINIYNKVFDIVLTDGSSFTDVSKLLIKK